MKMDNLGCRKYMWWRSISIVMVLSRSRLIGRLGVLSRRRLIGRLGVIIIGTLFIYYNRLMSLLFTYA
jgi:hypothetical protein